MIANLPLLVSLVVAALTPTTSHQQLRDAEGRAWMLVRSKKVLVLHAPRPGQLQVAIRSAGALKVRIRATGEILAAQPLQTGHEAALPDQLVGPPVLIRLPVPSGGEIFRIEVPRGRAWVAVSLLTRDGAEPFEQPEAEAPALVGLAPLMGKPERRKALPGLVGLAPLKQLQVKPERTPGLVALQQTRAEKRAKALRFSERRTTEVPTLKPLVAAKEEVLRPAEIDRPITGLPPVEDQEALIVTSAKRRPTRPLPTTPAGPTLLERLAKLQLGISVAGLADLRADRLAAKLEVEIDLPGTRRLLAAAIYFGFAPSSRNGVARIGGSGAALPLLVRQTTREIPLGLTLRARPLRLRLADRPVALVAALSAGWHLRDAETEVSSVFAAVRRPLTVSTQDGALSAALSLGGEVGVASQLSVGVHARLDIAQEQAIDAAELVKARFAQTAASLALSLRYRFAG
jgi:hypothetical protein